MAQNQFSKRTATMVYPHLEKRSRMEIRKPQGISKATAEPNLLEMFVKPTTMVNKLIIFIYKNLVFVKTNSLASATGSWMLVIQLPADNYEVVIGNRSNRSKRTS